MKVRKRDGSLQDFNIDKILIGIERASDDAHTPLNASDINLIKHDVLHSIENCGTDVITYGDIQNIVTITLLKFGFKTVVQYQMDYKNKHKK